VKRLLPCVIFALAFHAIILSTDFSWLTLAPGPAPASQSLTITLSADKLQKHKAQAVVPNKTPAKQVEAAFNQKPRENPAGMPAPARLEHTAQLQKPLPPAPPKNSVKKARQKKSLKALTRKKQIIKTSEIVRSASIDQRHVPAEVSAKISSPFSSGNKSNPLLVPADTTFIKKTQRVPGGTLESTTTATVQPATQINDTLSGAVLKIARPLYKQNTSPPYPQKARRLGYEGIVMLKVLIDENGRVDNLAVLKSSGYDILDRSALFAVKNWLFEPGTEGGIKKKMWVKIPIRFQLE
jgi:protein TonB